MVDTNRTMLTNSKMHSITDILRMKPMGVQQGHPAPFHQVPIQSQSNPFLPTPHQSNLEVLKSKKRNNRKKWQQLNLPVAPQVPQPMGNAALNVGVHQVLGAAPNPAPIPDPSLQLPTPPGQQWIFLANPATASVGTQPTTLPAPQPARPADVMGIDEPEKQKPQEKPKDELKTVQAAADKLQLVIESAMWGEVTLWGEVTCGVRRLVG